VCGRYAVADDPDELIREFEVEVDETAEPARGVLVSPQNPPPGHPDFNVAPTKQVPVVLTRAPRGSADDVAIRRLRLLTWGLVPSWARDPRGAARMVNARVESLGAKPAFSRALAARRCLVPASAWYEWQESPTARDAKGTPRRQPFAIRRADGASAAMAGLYEFWRDPQVADGDDPRAWLVTCTVITGPAEPGLDRIHERQPLVLERPDWERWLDPAGGADEALPLLGSRAPGRFVAYPVSRAVNAARATGPQLLDPAPVEDLDGVLDPVTGEILGGAR
jgi:putative SOS response-associated peptidase YedK